MVDLENIINVGNNYTCAGILLGVYLCGMCARKWWGVESMVCGGGWGWGGVDV